MSDSFNFEAECLRTASNEFHGDHVPLAVLRQRMANFIRAAEELDYVKKLLFYGEDEAKGRVRIEPIEGGIGDEAKGSSVALARLSKAAQPYLNIPRAEWLLHGVIGAATECGERMEAVYAAICEPQNGLDLVNVKEEIFDGQWYDAIACAAIDVTFDEGQRNIIDKLRKRFPDKFTEAAANNRDLDGERAVLEGDQREYAGVRFEAEERLFIPKAEATVAATDEADKEMLKQRLIRHFSETDAAIKMYDFDALMFCDAHTVARRTMGDSGRGWYVKTDFPTAIFTTARCGVCGQQVSYGHADKCPNKNNV